MALSTANQPRNRRFQLRATVSEETLINAAAERQRVNTADFIMRSACEVRAVMVHPIDDAARRFYQHFEFEPSPVDPFLWLRLLKDLRRAVHH